MTEEEKEEVSIIGEKIRGAMKTEYYPISQNKKLINKFLLTGFLFLIISFIIFTQFVGIGNTLNNEISYKSYLENLNNPYGIVEPETIKPFPFVTYVLIAVGMFLLLMNGGYFARIFMGEYLNNKEALKKNERDTKIKE